MQGLDEGALLPRVTARRHGTLATTTSRVGELLDDARATRRTRQGRAQRAEGSAQREHQHLDVGEWMIGQLGTYLAAPRQAQ
jgi:hypothetical protein